MRKLKNKNIYICSPSAVFDPVKYNIELALHNLEKLGFTVTLSNHALGNRGNTSGTIHERIDDLHEGFTNPKYDIVMCSRGGWNSNELLPHIEYELLRKYPKPFFGMSDTSTLVINLHQKSNIPTVYGHLLLHFGLSTNLDDFNQFVELSQNITLPIDVFPNGITPENIVQPGPLNGIAIPTNLAILNWMIGTPYELRIPKRAILMLEDDEEGNGHYWQMYLHRLEQAGYFKNIEGIILGKIIDGTFFNPQSPFDTIVSNFFQKYSFPVYKNAEFGHITNPVSIPFGAMMKVQG